MTCPICKSARHIRPLYTGITSWEYPGRFNFVRCHTCGLVFQSPRIAASRVDRYYDPKSYWGQVTDAWAEYAPLYKNIFRFFSRGSILDVGSGLGLFLSEFKRRGWSTLGTEISLAMAKYARRTYGLRILTGDLLHLNIKRKFGVITLNNVLEHLYQPRQTLAKVYRLLRPGGLVVIVVPNIASLGHLVFGRRWYHLQPGRHVYHFSPATLTRLLHLTGFKVLKISHSYWRHNYYSWFCNFRFNYSPRFTTGHPSTPSKPSLHLGFGKLLAVILAASGAILGQITGHGEVITVYCHR